MTATPAEAVIVVEFYPSGEEPMDDLHRTHLFDDEYRILLHDSHPLARRRAIAVSDLADADWIVTAGTGDYIREATMNLCQRAGYTPESLPKVTGSR